MNETWVTVVGNVASDVSWRRTPNGAEVANFRLMSSERRFEAESGSWEDGLRLAVRVNCWRRLGENVRACVTKGDPVVVRGKLTTREFEVDGVRRSSTEIEARAVGLDLARVVRQGGAVRARRGRTVGRRRHGARGRRRGPPGAESLEQDAGTPLSATLAGSVAGEQATGEDDGAGVRARGGPRELSARPGPGTAPGRQLPSEAWLSSSTP